MTTSLTALRKTTRYRLFESTLAITTYGFFGAIFLLSFLVPEIAASILLIYSFGWLLRVALINLYTIFTYKNLERWKKIDAYQIIGLLRDNRKKAILLLKQFQKKYSSKINHFRDTEILIEEASRGVGTIYENPLSIWHFPIFALYNEPLSVIQKSLRAVYDSQYDINKIVVFISQEGRYGKTKNDALRSQLKTLDFVQIHIPDVCKEADVYHPDHTTYTYQNKQFANLKLHPTKLNVICTAHPDGLSGEIIGKASNEDWAGRTISLFAKSRSINPELAIVTSLDADSSISKDYCALLSLRYACTPKENGRFGFQSIPVYTKNIFESTFIPRMIAFQTTLWTIAQNGMEGRTHFFANYSVPLVVLQEVDFWDREHIAEDYLFYARCYVRYSGNFRVLPFYGMFNGDAVIGDDYIHALENQYKQHQRWSWGGVESIAYLLEHFFVRKNAIPFSKRVAEAFGVFINHHFWATAPILFSVGLLLPAFFGGIAFEQSPIAQNLSLFSTYFAWISYSFVVVFAFLSYDLMQRTADLKESSKLQQIIIIVFQALLTPLAYALMALPAINAQTRGLMGKYLGYWVTPKK